MQFRFCFAGPSSSPRSTVRSPLQLLAVSILTVVAVSIPTSSSTFRFSAIGFTICWQLDLFAIDFTPFQLESVVASEDFTQCGAEKSFSIRFDLISNYRLSPMLPLLLLLPFTEIFLTASSSLPLFQRVHFPASKSLTSAPVLLSLLLGSPIFHRLPSLPTLYEGPSSSPRSTVRSPLQLLAVSILTVVAVSIPTSSSTFRFSAIGFTICWQLDLFAIDFTPFQLESVVASEDFTQCGAEKSFSIRFDLISNYRLSPMLPLLLLLPFTEIFLTASSSLPLFQRVHFPASKSLTSAPVLLSLLLGSPIFHRLPSLPTLYEGPSSSPRSTVRSPLQLLAVSILTVVAVSIPTSSSTFRFSAIGFTICWQLDLFAIDFTPFQLESVVASEDFTQCGAEKSFSIRFDLISNYRLSPMLPLLLLLPFTGLIGEFSYDYH
ncbi:hypothetical protein LXL04_026263 [Taraxacum kok-saghyz]